MLKIKTNKEDDAYVVDGEYYFRFERLNKDETKILNIKKIKKKSKYPAFFKIKNDTIKKRILCILTQEMKKNLSNILLKQI